MSNNEREDLLKQAEELSLDVPKNTRTDKLRAMIDEVASPQAASDEDGDEQMDDSQEAPQETDTQSPPEEKPAGRPLTKQQRFRQKVAEKKRAAMKTRVVTITNRDNRDNDFTTTATLSFENQHFGMSKIVPLDMPVELEEALIHVAETARITLHKDEVRNGRRTGNKVPVSVKKYAISYSQNQPE